MNQLQMSKHKKRVGVKGLLAAGIIFGLTGIAVICHPIPYVSLGGVGYQARTPVMSVFSGSDTVVMGFLFLFMSGFVLYVAYRVKKD